MTLPHAPLPVGVVCDYREEEWPSMDLVADMLLAALREEHAAGIAPIELRPRMPRPLDRAPVLGGTRAARIADRLAGRFVHYPRWLARRPVRPAVYHIVDHSYSHLVHGLPANRTVVTCHDLDTFRSVLQPAAEPRSWMFRAMTKRILSGLCRAARVTCDSIATRDEILAHGLIPEERLEVVYLGVDPVMSPVPDREGDEGAMSLLGPLSDGWTDLLHVGSTIPRKRIDTVLRTFAGVSRQTPRVRLIRVGGEFTESQAALARDLGIDPAVVMVMPRISRIALAAVYRRAALVLQPSDAEGFGLPLVEAMACGVPVVASDLPVLREVGGPAGVYCPVGDVESWSGTVCAMLRERRENPSAWEARRNRVLEWSTRYSWSRFADRLADIYRAVAASPAGAVQSGGPRARGAN